MTKQISFMDFTVKLKDRVLFENLNMVIEEGDRYIFLGPNGIGKSLVLDLICLGNSRELSSRYKGLTVSGTIIDSEGKNLLDPSTKRKIAYVSQNEDFYRGKTIKEICQTSCLGIGIRFNEEKFNYLLNAFDIYDKKNQKFKNNLSFGEGKIVHIISRILKLEGTNLMILDEPLNHLSFKNSKIFNDLILDEIKTNPKLSIIMVSHCRAINFTSKALVYIPEKKNLEIRDFHSYDCFSYDAYSGCL